MCTTHKTIEAIGSDTQERPTSSMDFALEYINAGPPYAGESNFKDKDRVKQLGARWGSNKKWVAHTHEVLQALIESRLWTPSGLGSSGAVEVVNCLYNMQRARARASGGQLRFDRRDSAVCTFDPDMDRKRMPNGAVCTYACKCEGCGVLLDSRLQFGLECDCVLGSAWVACQGCCLPVRHGSPCPLCK